MDKKIKDMRKESKNINAEMIVGKNGITESVVKNINDALRKNTIVKIKILKTYIDEVGKQAAFDEIATKTGAQIVNKIGFTITLTKK